MSGVDKIKAKAKLSLDEMFDNTESGLPEIRKSVQPDTRTEVRRDGQPEVQLDNQTEVRLDGRTNYRFPNRKDGRNKEKMDCKMTFNVNQDTFDAFNEIYKKRLIEGNDTNKAVLICEAIQLLYEKEQGL